MFALSTLYSGDPCDKRGFICSREDFIQFVTQNRMSSGFNSTILLSSVAVMKAFSLINLKT